MSRRSFCRSPADFFAAAKSRSWYSRLRAGGRPRDRTLTATPPSRRMVRPASRAAARTRRPSVTTSAWISEESDGPPLRVDVDGEGGRRPSVAGHRLHVAAERDEPARPCVRADVSDGDGEAGRRVRERRVVREREVSLGHADREVVEADALELLDPFPRGGLKEASVDPGHARHDCLDLALDRIVEGIYRREARGLLGRLDHGFGERRGTLAPADH